MIVAVAIVAFLFADVGSYYRLSRRSLKELAPHGLDGILYVSIEEIRRDDKALSQHYRLMWLYTPVNCIDRLFFHKNDPVACWMRLSG